MIRQEIGRESDYSRHLVQLFTVKMIHLYACRILMAQPRKVAKALTTMLLIFFKRGRGQEHRHKFWETWRWLLRITLIGQVEQTITLPS